MAERQRGVSISAALHAVFLLIFIFGLPDFLSPKRVVEPQAISVELLTIADISNVKMSETQPQKEEKPEPIAEEKEPVKATPPVKTSEPAPPPPPPPKPAEKPKEKKEEKKPEPPKEIKKPKPKEDDLAAILKAVKDTAQKKKPEESEKPKEQENGAPTKSRSTSYDPSKALSLSEADAIRSQIAKCWSVPAGAKDAHELIVVVEMQLDRDGTVIKVALANESKSRYNRDSFFRAAADSAIRAVRLCSPLKDLPSDKYDTWKDVEMTFDPKEMLF